jgi:NAD(P)-dependent dehydrogenase (short-subunit alcohol dehydrogenase family)
MGGQFAFPGMSLYHTSKWAIEGFFDSVSREVTTFGIETCLVEPGSARTDFGFRSLSIGAPLDAYADSPAAMVRKRAETRQRADVPGAATKMAAAMIAAADAEKLPRRLLLGSDAYQQVTTALTERLAEAEAQKDLAATTDFAADAAAAV